MKTVYIMSTVEQYNLHTVQYNEQIDNINIDYNQAYIEFID